MTALSIVIPVFNERGNIGPLVQEVVQHLRGRIPFDIVCVDDQSQDDTRDVLTALKAGVVTPSTLINTNPGYLALNSRYTIRDVPRNNGVLTVTGVITKSSNIGSIKIAEKLRQLAERNRAAGSSD